MILDLFQLDFFLVVNFVDLIPSDIIPVGDFRYYRLDLIPFSYK